MPRELTQDPQFPATFTVAGAAFSGVDAGQFLVDAPLTKYLITAVNSTTLTLSGQSAPNVGTRFSVGSSPGWTVNAYTGGLLVDHTGAQFVIFSNTAGVLSLSGTPASGAWKILVGGAVVATSVQFPGTVTIGASGVGVWTIVDSTGTLKDSSATDTGAATIVAGGPTTSLAGFNGTGAAQDGRGILGLTLLASIPDGASSESVTVNIQGNNLPSAGVGANSYWGTVGPSPLDPGWTDLPTSLDGAASTVAAQTIADTDNHIIATVPGQFVRWYRVVVTPGAGTGTFTSFIYAWGNL